MEIMNLAELFAEFKDSKNIDRETLLDILEEVFRSVLEKKYGSAENFDIIINVDKNDVEIWRNRKIVEDGNVQDPNKEIAYAEAILREPDMEIGEDFTQEVSNQEFSRRNILSLKQSLNSRINEYKKGNVFNKYKDRIGEIITAEVYQTFKKETLLVDEDGVELVIPKSEQIPSDYFRKGDTVRAIVKEVALRNNNPVIILSRTSPVFLERLFELEVPEIYDGLITIKKIVREPGERAKVAVESYDDRVDPVGACVGMKGSRIHGIVRELGNENIDVINYTGNLQLLIQRSLSPAKITSIRIDDEKKRAEVYLKPDQVPLAIGKGGFNIRLATKLTGFDIDVYRELDTEDTEDVDLDEFSDEIDNWIIDALKGIGCDTAKSVLELSVEDLARRTDLEEETIKEVKKILQAEFEENP